MENRLSWNGYFCHWRTSYQFSSPSVRNRKALPLQGETCKSTDSLVHQSSWCPTALPMGNWGYQLPDHAHSVSKGWKSPCNCRLGKEEKYNIYFFQHVTYLSWNREVIPKRGGSVEERLNTRVGSIACHRKLPEFVATITKKGFLCFIMYYGFPANIDVLPLGQAGVPQRAAPPDDCLCLPVTRFPSNCSEMLSSLNTAPNHPFTRSCCWTNTLWEQAQTCKVPLHLVKAFQMPQKREEIAWSEASEVGLFRFPNMSLAAKP